MTQTALADGGGESRMRNGNHPARRGTVVAGVFLLLACVAATAGVELDLRLEHDEYLQFEPVKAYVSVYNDSDKPLVIRSRARGSVARLDLMVRRNRNDVMNPKSEAPAHGGTVLEADGRTELMLEVDKTYDIAANGRYFVKAALEHEGRVYETPTRILNVVPGMELAKVQKSVPGDPDRIRDYSLRYWTRDGTESLFLRVDEGKTRLNFGVFDLGPLVRVATPVLKVDRNGDVLVVHQCARNCHIRSVLKSVADGVTLQDQSYHLPNGDPYPYVRPMPRKRR